MKLHEIRRLKDNYSSSTEITIEPADGIYGEVALSVEFNYEPPNSTLHVPGDSSTREYHPAQIEISSVKTAQAIIELDEDGKPTGKSWPAGTDAGDLPGWSKKDDELVLDEVYREIDKTRNRNDYD